MVYGTNFDVKELYDTKIVRSWNEGKLIVYFKL